MAEPLAAGVIVVPDLLAVDGEFVNGFAVLLTVWKNSGENNHQLTLPMAIRTIRLTTSMIMLVGRQRLRGRRGIDVTSGSCRSGRIIIRLSPLYFGSESILGNVFLASIISSRCLSIRYMLEAF